MNAARKTMQKTSPRVYTVYIQYICVHSCAFEALAFIDIESLGLQLSTKFHGKKKTRRLKIRDTTFWACFRQDLDLNVQSPSFSAIFPPFSAVFPPFSAVFCPLNFQFFQVFPGLPLFFLMTTIFVVFTSVAFWKHAANAKKQQTIPVRQHFVSNDSLADRF